MSERDGAAEGAENAGGSSAAPSSIWTAERRSGVEPDEQRPATKVCRNMKNIGFGGMGGDGEPGNTAVPVGEDMRTAWRDLLRREGKLHADPLGLGDPVRR